MPDDPLDRGSQPEEELRRLIEEIEEDVAKEKPVPAPTHEEPIDDPLARILGASHDADLDEDRLTEIAEAVQRAGDTKMPEPPEWNFQRPEIPGQRKPDAGTYLGIGVGLSVAYAIVGATLGGWLVGFLIDRAQGGGAMGQAIGTLVGAVIGLVGAIFTILRAQSREKP